MGEIALFPIVKIDDVTHVIQLAVAPVFLLTGVGTIIGVLTNRLARIVDRSRILEERAAPVSPHDSEQKQFELQLLARRLRLVYIALMCQVCCGLFVGLIIATAFIDAFLIVNLSSGIAGLFVIAMFAFISGLVIFLREIFLAVISTRASMR